MLAEMSKVTKHYGRREAVHEISLAINPGEVVGLLGPNGAGKTTSLKLLAGLLFPDSGTVQIMGVPPRQARAEVSYLPEGLYGWMKPRDVDRFMSGLYPRFSRPRYYELLQFLEVPDARADRMSKGQEARFRLALSLALEVPLYLLDEPLSGIDLVARERILKAMVQNWRENSALVLATHEISEAEGMFDRAIFLKEGQVILDRSAEDLRAEGKSVTQAYLEVFS